MKKYIFFFVIVFVLNGCSMAELEASPNPTRTMNSSVPKELPSSFLERTNILPFQNVSSSFIEIVDWYNEDHILYLEESDERSYVYTYHLFTGTSELLFETDGWVVDLKGNADQSLFAIQTYSTDNKSTLVVINEEGQIKRIIEDLGEEYSVFWNSYDPTSMVLISFLPDWKFVAYHLDITVDQLTEVDLTHPYVQWLSESTFAYLNWDEFEPSYHAPLVIYHTDTKETTSWQEDIIAFASFTNELSLAVTVQSPDSLYSTYTFYQNQEPYRKIEMPILNTYSEQWWIPFYTYDSVNDVFYYLRPKYSSDYFSYEDGYELVAYSVKEDSERKITTFDRHEPLSVSPSGDAVLIGDRYERIYDVDRGNMIYLLEDE
ncbi:membrane lipoprotein lipid attachment site-containing protein [Halalkalibacter sp. AB-rgal2]|uniref:membrane lipoprotein lipid attachment site-containing protein n=1 Tax=Halalkalibacter sp. AB-rgal2 TaxID=3242695 RepID=UPI00359E0F19